MIDKLAKNQKDLLYDAAVIDLLGTIADAIKKKPSSKLIQMSKSVQDIIFYVNDLRMERFAYDEFMKRRTIKELKLEEKVKELEQELYSYEDNTIERRADFEADAAVEDAR
jgi:hypothetical protein